jgi:hypothetical protein
MTLDSMTALARIWAESQGDVTDTRRCWIVANNFHTLLRAQPELPCRFMLAPPPYMNYTPYFCIQFHWVHALSHETHVAQRR